jgi:hypothetical protein
MEIKKYAAYVNQIDHEDKWGLAVIVRVQSQESHQ